MLSERIQDIPQAPSTTPVMEPTSKLHSLATWLLGYLWYTCDVLGYLATCLPSVPSVQVEERDEEANMTSNAVNRVPCVHTMDSSDVADCDHKLESKHKVFLSHSGAQKDFVEQLCVDLERCDRYPFFDKRRSSLPVGEKFPTLIFDAIEQCQVGVVVLSEDFFVRSKWPMLELHAMVKEFEKPNSSLRIIPVFYCISLNAFKDAKNQCKWTSQWRKWALNDKRINVEEWKRALKVVGSINSVVLREGCGGVKFREEIVVEVCGLVPPETRWDDSHVQGRSRSCKVIRDKMDQVLANSKVGFVGLYGVGGIGKTTISKALCNDLSPKYCENVCHIEMGSRTDMELLQKALKKLTEIRHDVLDKLDDTEEGCTYLKMKLRTQPIFLALDNVQGDYKSMEVVQMYLKAGYGCGSVVLVTARSLNVLKKLNLDEKNCLEMPELEEDEARTLFLNYVDLPSRHLVDEVLLKDCIERCHFFKADGKSRHYHPLALKVLGQQLGCNTAEWAAQLRSIDTFNQLKDSKHPVFSILRNSFDSLNGKHQLVFMDLALLVTSAYNDLAEVGSSRRDWLCMVHEETVEDMRDMVRVVNMLHFILLILLTMRTICYTAVHEAFLEFESSLKELEVLKRKSLVEDLSDDFSRIGMHDLWIEFAVAETKAQDPRDQRWLYQVDAKKALGRSGRWRESVERMCFVNEGWKGLKGINLDDFVNVEAFKLEVQILMADCTLDLDLSGLKHLKSLELDTPGLAVRANGLSSLTNLVFLYWITPRFSPCLAGIGRLTNLQFLQLWGCKGTKVLDLTELIFLRAAHICHFPDLIAVRGLSSRMRNLRFLRILRCKSLRECPGVGELYALEKLVLKECDNLEELACLGRLTNLRVLNIGECKSLRAVPGLSELVNLEEVHAGDCLKLAALPDLMKLTKLRVLDIINCPVQEVSGLDGLISLTKLRASLGELSGKQPVLSKLSALKLVLIEGWNGPIWTSIRSLVMLEELRLCQSNGDDVVPDLQNLERLKLVWLRKCEYKDLSGLSNSTALETLKLVDCDKLKRLPEFERLTKLTDLCMTGCGNLRDWPSERTWCSLKCLQVDGSSLMRFVRELKTLTGLRKLTLWGSECENVLSMASLTSQLETLVINRFSTSEAFDFSTFPQLEEVEVWRCSTLNRVTCSIPLTALTVLKVVGCESLVEMPDLSMFPQLKKIRVEECSALMKLTCSRPLTALRKIKLIGCERGVEMPDYIMFPNLRDFRVEEDPSEGVEDNDDGDNRQVGEVADHLS